jgi:hypothetical protein
LKRLRQVTKSAGLAQLQMEVLALDLAKHNNGHFASSVSQSKAKLPLAQVEWSFLVEWPTFAPNSTDWSP